MLRLLIILMATLSGVSPKTPANQAPSSPALSATRLRPHDPVIAREGDVYYLYSTGNGIPIHTSRDLKTWTRAGVVFGMPLEWAQKAVPGFRDHIWAPDITFFNGKWHLYYSISTFGSNRSAIGVATNATLDPTRKDYHWTDEGSVFESQKTDNFNAIDPNVVFDEKGNLYLSFGSFWSGIKLLRLDAKTGKVLASGSPLFSLASRPHDADIKGAVEAPFIVRHGGFYYLFVSFDLCCRGVNSTYNIRVGRASSIEGPYFDRDGKAMLGGGGTLLLGTQGTMIGPGHCSILRDKERDYLVYHFYDGERAGMPTLGVRPLNWKNGWPEIIAPYIP